MLYVLSVGGEHTLTKSGIGVISNTTSPPSDHIPLGSDIRSIDVVSQMYRDGFFPVLLCPPALLANIIRINHLRLQAFLHPTTEYEAKALELLGRITAFSPGQWAMSCGAPEKGISLGHVYRSAVILYCILSLQSLSVLPRMAQLRTMIEAHTKELFTYLKLACGEHLGSESACSGRSSWPECAPRVIWPCNSLSIDNSQLWERTSGLLYLCWRQSFSETSGRVRAEPGTDVLRDHTVSLCRLSGPDNQIDRPIRGSDHHRERQSSRILDPVACP